jgi:hypothetical protein
VQATQADQIQLYGALVAPLFADAVEQRERAVMTYFQQHSGMSISLPGSL